MAPICQSPLPRILLSFPFAALRFVSIRFLFDFFVVVVVVVVSIKFTTQNAVGQTNRQTNKQANRHIDKQTNKTEGQTFL